MSALHLGIGGLVESRGWVYWAYFIFLRVLIFIFFLTKALGVSMDCGGVRIIVRYVVSDELIII